jgi:hypothetical protein
MLNVFSKTNKYTVEKNTVFSVSSHGIVSRVGTNLVEIRMKKWKEGVKCGMVINEVHTFKKSILKASKR